MTCVKFCGITRACDVESINALHRSYPKTPLYVGFVFYAPSKRAISASQALQLKSLLAPEISTVGVFVNEQPAAVASLLNSGVIDYAQLHGSEDEAYIARLCKRTKKPLIQAFCVKQACDIERARTSSAAMVLLDAGKGEGARFNWSLLGDTRADARADAQNDAPANRNNVLQRAYLLAGGLSPENVFLACELCHPFGVDVSSGIETQGSKDPAKMQQFLEEVVRFDTWYAAPTQATPFAQSAPTQATPFAQSAPTQATPFVQSAPTQATPFAKTAPTAHAAQLAPAAHDAANAAAHAQPAPASAPAQAATNGTSTHSPCSQRRHHD